VFFSTSDNERGAAAVFVAAALVAIMAIVALAVDGGLAFDDRRGTQNAADLAALAAAWEACNPQNSSSTPEKTARDVAEENGYTHDAGGGFPKVDVTSAGNDWTVTITEQNDATFGRATADAPNQIKVSSESTARCVDNGVLDGYAVFGGAGCPGQKEVDLQSSTLTVNGGVHSNGDFRIPNSSTINGPLTYRDTPNINHSGTTETLYPGAALMYPAALASLSTSDYAPGGSRVPGSAGDYHPFTGKVQSTDLLALPGANEVSGVIELSQPGVYYTDDSFEISKDIRLVGPAFVRGVTFVADNQIQLKGFYGANGFDRVGSSTDLGLFLFAGGDGSAQCNATDIKISTSGAVWNGVMYAPYGQIDISGSDVSSLNGALIAYRVSVSASNFSITYDGGSTSNPNYKVELVG
jgi:Flp pilus assembly protein TadG